MKRTIAVFDFDGTLTRRDTLLEFIRYACGLKRFFCGFMLYAPILLMMKVKLYPNWKAKQKIFSHFFKGMDYSEFLKLGADFSDVVESFRRNDTIGLLEKHVREGHTVYVVSASIDEWVRPWCCRLGVTGVLSTKIEVDSRGCITGRFLTKNCYGQEKVNRLLEAEPHRDEYFLYAYGDSRGDKEMLEFADEGKYVL